jgi:hypothetical protein
MELEGPGSSPRPVFFFAAPPNTHTIQPAGGASWTCFHFHASLRWLMAGWRLLGPAHAAQSGKTRAAGGEQSTILACQATWQEYHPVFYRHASPFARRPGGSSWQRQPNPRISVVLVLSYRNPRQPLIRMQGQSNSVPVYCQSPRLFLSGESMALGSREKRATTVLFTQARKCVILLKPSND